MLIEEFERKELHCRRTTRHAWRHLLQSWGQSDCDLWRQWDAWGSFVTSVCGRRLRATLGAEGRNLWKLRNLRVSHSKLLVFNIKCFWRNRFSLEFLFPWGTHSRLSMRVLMLSLRPKCISPNSSNAWFRWSLSRLTPLFNRLPCQDRIEKYYSIVSLSSLTSIRTILSLTLCWDMCWL